MNEADYPHFAPDPPARPWWRRRLFLGAALVFVLAVAAFVGLFVYWGTAADRELQRAMAELDEKEPGGWRLEELEARRTVVPDKQNGALCVMAVKKLLPEPWPPRPRPAPALVGEPGPDQLLPPPPDVPPVDERVGNLPLELQLDVALTEELRLELEKVFPALAEAGRLADLPAGRFPVTWAPDAISTILNSQQARAAANLLRLEAVLWAQDGHPDRAVRSARGVLNAGRSVGDEPTLISLLIRIAVQAVALRSLEHTLAQGEPSAAELETFQRLLEDEAGQPLFYNALRGERACMHRTLGALVAGKTSLSQLGGGGGKPSVGEEIGEILAMPGIKRGNARLLRILTEYIEVSKLPVEQHADRLKPLLPPDKPRARGIEDIVVNLLLPAVEKVAESYRRGQAKLRCGVTALAAERYRRLHGRWPDALDELATAKLLAAVPTDPFGGALLRFRRTADGVVVYSISLDGQDNGGKLSEDFRAAGTDLGFRLWDPARRRQPAHEWVPPPRLWLPEVDPEG
jgi:hypothetical protein